MSGERQERQRQLARTFGDSFATATEGLDCERRVTWLLDHLRDYLGRWSGLCSYPGVTVKSLLESDIHFLLIVAADAIEEEVRSLPEQNPMLRNLSGVATIVRSVRPDSDIGLCRELSDTLLNVLNEATKEATKGTNAHTE